MGGSFEVEIGADAANQEYKNSKIWTERISGRKVRCLLKIKPRLWADLDWLVSIEEF